MRLVIGFWTLIGLVLGHDTGFPAGLMADCPGMNRSTILSSKTKNSITVLVMKPSYIFGDEKKLRVNKAGAEATIKFLDLKRKTQVIISGYLDATFSPFMRGLASTYLKTGSNVIMLELFPVLVRPYPIAARITKPIGLILGEYLSTLSLHGLNADRLELIGGSLGAHIASHAAHKYKQLTGRQPARLTGLDPAGPCFRNMPPSERFNSAAARKVDALHTNIDGFGLADAVAHVDFYANGGEYQPFMIGDFVLPCFHFCSHVRAAIYWMLAFQNPEKFLAVKCDSVGNARRGDCYNNQVESNLLGPKTNFSRPGVYYLPTTEAPPYYKGQEAMKRKKYGSNDYLLKAVTDTDLVV